MSKPGKSKRLKRNEGVAASHSSGVGDDFGPDPSQQRGSLNAGSSMSQRRSQPSSSSQMTDNGEDPTPSGSSQGSKLSHEELEKLTESVATYILNHDSKKCGVRRQDISSNVLKNHGRCFNVVIEKVKEFFSETYGFKLVEVDKKRYFLVSNTLFPEEVQHPLDIKPQQSLLLIVLSYLFMMQRPVQEDHMYQFLEKAQILTKKVNEEHEYFGDVRRLITKDFVFMRYLVYKRRGDSDSSIYEFSIGERTVEEVPYCKLLEFVCQVNGANLNDYPSQLEEVKQQEKTVHTELAALQID